MRGPKKQGWDPTAPESTKHFEWPIEFCGSKDNDYHRPVTCRFCFSDSESSLKVEAGHILDSGFPNHPHNKNRDDGQKDPGYTGQAKDEGETTTSTEKNERSMVAF